jgi:hypothetical protein
VARRRLEEDAFFGLIKTGLESHSIATDMDKADFIASSRFPQQQKAAEDPSRFISVRCPRRAGKSWFALSLAMESCLRNPGAQWVIVGIARPSVKNIYWRTFKMLNEEMELGCHFKGMELIVEFPNGSTVRFLGGADRQEIEKIRGGAYHGVILDECASYPWQVLEELIDDIVTPALGDYLGKLVLIGTPGPNLKGPFYEATCDPPRRTEESGKWSNRRYGSQDPPEGFIWSLHSWSRLDNVKMPHLVQEGLDIKAKKGWRDDNPTWRREYLGEWVAYDGLQVYRFKVYEHTYVPNRDPASMEPWRRLGLPHEGPWSFCVGADLGFDDPFGIVVWAWSTNDPCLYEVYSLGMPHLSVAGAAHQTEVAIDETGHPDVMVADRAGLGKMILSELASQYDIHYEPAEKGEKNDHIELFNDDLDAGRIKIIRGSALAKELDQHQWDEKTLFKEGKKVESKTTANDVADAGLYGFRAANHRRYRNQLPTTPHGSAQWLRDKEEAAFKLAAEQYQRAKDHTNFSGLDKDWWSN